jgi:acyl carrier protein
VKRDALPDIEDAASTRPYTAPRDDVEKQLCRLWAGVLDLEKENIGIDDNFFELGGHSLRATILISKIHKTFNVKLILGQLFSQPTVRGLAQVLKDAKRETFRAIEPAGERPYYPMSSAQKRMYIVHQLEKESLNYNMPAPLMVDGPVDKDKFETVFRQLIRRQEGLRTRFVIREGEAVQEIAAPEEVEFAVQYETGSEIDHEIDRFVRPFDLAQAPLFRVGLVKLAPEKFLLLVDFHHIIGDGVSMGVLIHEFTRIYGGDKPPPLRIQYRDYALWQQQLVESGELKRQEEYWLNQLDADIPILNLPLDYPRPAMMRFEGRWLDFEISAEVTEKLKKCADRYDATLYMVLLAAYNVLLHKYTGRETIVVGSVTAGRSHPDLENIIGVFLNTLAMKNNPSDSLTFTRFLEQVRENALRAYENQDYQFEELVEKLNLKRDYSRSPVFDTMLNFINMEIPAIKLGDLKITPYKMESEAVKFDIKINAREQDGLLRCTLDYSNKLFKPDTMETFIDNYIKIAEKIAEDPGIKISDIRLMSEKEERKMVEEFSKELEYDF